MKKMKKVLKWGGIVLVVIIVIGVVAGGSSNTTPNSNTQEVKKEDTNVETEIKRKELLTTTSPKNRFTEQSALKKIQDYQITIDLESPTIHKGTTIAEVYTIKGQIPAVKNNGWFTEESGKPKTFIVGYRQTISDQFPIEPRWEVSENKIRAINGKAISITPEFGPQEKKIEGSELEIQVYNYLKDLFKKYHDQVFTENDLPTGEQLDEAERKALLETAQKYNLTTDQVEEIYLRLDK
jgi:hypothetical protein